MVRWLVLAAITILAAFLRLCRIDSLPPGDGYDPAYYGVDALRILEGAHRTYFPPNREPMFSYIVAGSFRVFGASTQSIHLTSALVGIVSVPAVYFAANEILSGERRVLRHFGGLTAASMMATSYWHLNWSRYGVRAILVPFFTAVTLGLLWRGLRTGRRWAFALCGLALGLSIYTYQAARLLPILVAVGLVGSLTGRKKGALSCNWADVAVVSLAALLAFAPLGCHFLKHPSSLFRRIEEASVIQTSYDAASNVRAVLEQATEAALAFSVLGDRTPYSTVPGRPSLNPFFSALFILGIAVSLSRANKLTYLLLLAWLAVMFVPAMLAGKGPTAKRAIGTLPAVAMLIAVGALTPWTTLKRRLGQRSPQWANRLRAAWGVVVLCGFAYSGIVTYRDYFITWASNPNLPTHFEAGISAIGDYIGDLPPGEQVYTSPEPPSHPAIRFHSGLREDIRGYNGRVCLVVPHETMADTTYVIVPGKDGKSLDLLRRHFSEGRVTHQQSVGRNHPYFLAYRIPAATRADLQPTYPSQTRWSDHIQLLGHDLDKDAYRAGETIELTLYYQDLERMEERYTAFVHLLGPENPATGGPLWAQNDSEPCHGFYPTTSWHEGEILSDRIGIHIPDDAPTGIYRLATGFYDVWTGERLPADSRVAPTDHDVLVLGEVQIKSAD